MYDMYMYLEKIYVWERDMERERYGERERRERVLNWKLICNWLVKYIKYLMII